MGRKQTLQCEGVIVTIRLILVKREPFSKIQAIAIEKKRGTGRNLMKTQVKSGNKTRQQASRGSHPGFDDESKQVHHGTKGAC